MVVQVVDLVCLQHHSQEVGVEVEEALGLNNCYKKRDRETVSEHCMLFTYTQLQVIVLCMYADHTSCQANHKIYDNHMQVHFIAP